MHCRFRSAAAARHRIDGAAAFEIHVLSVQLLRPIIKCCARSSSGGKRATGAVTNQAAQCDPGHVDGIACPQVAAHTSVPHRASGFTLIELMITVAVIAILAAIAIPAYGDYVRRSKITEASSSLSDMRNRLEQYFLDNRQFPVNCIPAAAGAAPVGSRSTCLGGHSTSRLPVPFPARQRTRSPRPASRRRAWATLLTRLTKRTRAAPRACLRDGREPAAAVG